VTLDDNVERLRAKKQRYLDTEREGGLEFGEGCGTEDAEYCELLRIASAMDEVRKEIEAQALQDLIDPEHKMDAGDWVRFWEDRGFSDASEPNDVWDKVFADCAARLFRKPRRQM
jgi:hypothetical protein